MLSLGVYGLMMAGWASANNYALLGGQRAAALMISAEIAIGASIMGVVMVYGSLNMQDIARGQGQPLLPQFFGSWIPAWGILTQPLAFILFLTAGIAATKRIPFDMPGGRVGDHRLLRRVQRDEVRHVRHGRLPRDGGDRGHDAPRCSWAAGRCRTSRPSGFAFPWGASVALPHLAGDGAPGRRLPHQGRGHDLVPHADPLDAARASATTRRCGSAGSASSRCRSSTSWSPASCSWRWGRPEPWRLPDDEHPRRSAALEPARPPPALLPGRGADAGSR